MTSPDIAANDQQLIDLEALAQAIGLSNEQDGVVTPRRRVSMIGHDQQAVKAEPLPVELVLDGIQAAVRLAYRGEHRSIWLTYTAAGALELAHRQFRGLEQHLSLVYSWKDDHFVRSLPGGIREFVCLDEQDPAELDAAVAEFVGQQRHRAEATVAEQLHLDDDEVLVVDGSLQHLPPREHGTILGLVKTTGHQYLQDEHAHVPHLAGHRSPTFLIHRRRRTEHDRFSSYLRMHDTGPDRPWPLGLVRLEAHDPNLLDGFAAWTLGQRQSRNVGDPRYRRHAAAVRTCEDVLRAIRPPFFDIMAGH